MFLTRYVDLFWNFHSLYNTIMKIFFISSSLYTYVFFFFACAYTQTSQTRCYLVAWRFRATRDVINDVCRPEYIIVPCAILALIFNYEFILTEIVWSFSIYLESVAIMPQLFLLQKTGEGDNITAHYMFALGLYVPPNPIRKTSHKLIFKTS